MSAVPESGAPEGAAEEPARPLRPPGTRDLQLGRTTDAARGAAHSSALAPMLGCEDAMVGIEEAEGPRHWPDRLYWT